VLKSQQPHTGQTQRIFTRPLSAMLSRGCGSSPVRRKPATARAIENALLVKRWHSVQWHVYTNRGASLIS
jgi:hypothetical protein